MKNENTWKLNHLKEIWQKEARQETAKRLLEKATAKLDEIKHEDDEYDLSGDEVIERVYEIIKQLEEEYDNSKN